MNIINLKLKERYNLDFRYWDPSGPIIKLLNSIYDENNHGENWFYHSQCDEAGHVVNVELHIKDPEVALLFKLKFGDSDV